MKELKKVTKVFNKYTSDILDNNSVLINLFIKYIVKNKRDDSIIHLINLGAFIGGKHTDRTIKACAMYSVIHTATIIHKEVEDYIAPSQFYKIKKIWQSKLAVLLGDLLLSKGMLYAVKNKEYEILKDISSAINISTTSELDVIKLYSKAIIEEKYYNDIIAKKTIIDTITCIKIGYKTTNNVDNQNIDNIAYNIGLIIQLSKDLYTLKKNIKSRKVNYSILYPFVLSYNSCSENEKSYINSLSRRNTVKKKETETIKHFISKFRGVKKTEMLIEKLYSDVILDSNKLFNKDVSNEIIRLLSKIIK